MITRTIFLIGIFASSFTLSSMAQCSDATTQKARILKTIFVDQKSRSEVTLTVKASAPKSSWVTPDSEAAVLTVFIDGRYIQDIVLFAGAKVFEYTALMGRLDTGRHKVDVALNEERSAPKAGTVTVHSAETKTIKTTNPVEELAIANSPVLYVRPGAVDKFSDIPLVTYYEIFPEGPQTGKIRYTTVYSNEDGGTQTAALMARWGRATDIEWVYEIGYRDGKRTTETYQAANHETKTFTGERDFGEHPHLLTATVNNNLADRGCSALKIVNLPVRVDLSKRSRESVMDEHPWTYLVMSQEAMREGRVDPTSLGPNVIDDPRTYLYVDIYTELSDAAVSVQLKAEGGRTSSSDLGDARLRIARSGFQRTAVRLSSSLTELTAITISCHRNTSVPDSGCKDQKIVSVTGLDRTYEPVSLQPGKGLRKATVIGSNQ